MHFQVSKLDLLVTGKAIMLIGRELVKKGKDKGKLVEVCVLCYYY